MGPKISRKKQYELLKAEYLRQKDEFMEAISEGRPVSLADIEKFTNEIYEPKPPKRRRKNSSSDQADTYMMQWELFGPSSNSTIQQRNQPNEPSVSTLPMNPPIRRPRRAPKSAPPRQEGTSRYFLRERPTSSKGKMSSTTETVRDNQQCQKGGQPSSTHVDSTQ